MRNKALIDCGDAGRLSLLKCRSRLAVAAVVILGVGGLPVVLPTVAEGLPPNIPAPTECPMGDAFSGFQYVRDPANNNAYYLCAGGLPQNHVVCPGNTVLNMATNPPSCVPWRANY
jgi:hypothetical protein